VLGQKKPNRSQANLRFLALFDNQIETIQNIRHLRQLQYLDASRNKIQDFDTDELPQSLRVLRLSGNACVEHPQYRQTVLSSLPNLKELDGVPITDYILRQCGVELDGAAEARESPSAKSGVVAGTPAEGSTESGNGADAQQRETDAAAWVGKADMLQVFDRTNEGQSLEASLALSTLKSEILHRSKQRRQSLQEQLSPKAASSMATNVDGS